MPDREEKGFLPVVTNKFTKNNSNFENLVDISTRL